MARCDSSFLKPLDSERLYLGRTRKCRCRLAHGHTGYHRGAGLFWDGNGCGAYETTADKMVELIRRLDGDGVSRKEAVRRYKSLTTRS